METLRGPQLTMNDGATLVTEVVSDDDSHLCLYILLQDMIKIGDMVVGFDIEWGFKGTSSSRSGSTSGRNSEHHSQPDKSEHLPRRVEHHIAVLTFCTKLGCVLIRLSPNHISPSLKRFLSIKDILFVGVHIKEDLQRLRCVDGLVVRNAVELSELAAKIYDQPRLAAYSARELAYRIASLKVDSKPLNVLWSNWFEHTLSHEQIESATTDAYATYKIGKKIMESGSSSVKRLFS
ncbi:3-5 EXONUCLEASE [Salix purpurea]|uniref:3-5 EXONUCLEASE n=1 Tax=Salix purpurea TaxID=77065 RepID=A0A9Q0V9L7_SALPP|nr:3-5 EXONUCLEASE [Salix purpurea]